MASSGSVWVSRQPGRDRKHCQQGAGLGHLVRGRELSLPEDELQEASRAQFSE